MRFLPIVVRELRGGSRRRGTYWLRVRVAFQAILVGVAAYVVNVFQPQIKLGTVLFWGLSGVGRAIASYCVIDPVFQFGCGRQAALWLEASVFRTGFDAPHKRHPAVS